MVFFLHFLILFSVEIKFEVKPTFDLVVVVVVVEVVEVVFVISFLFLPANMS